MSGVREFCTSMGLEPTSPDPTSLAPAQGVLVPGAASLCPKSLLTAPPGSLGQEAGKLKSQEKELPLDTKLSLRKQSYQMISMKAPTSS